MSIFGRIWASLDPSSQDAFLDQFGTAGRVVNVARKAHSAAQVEAARAFSGGVSRAGGGTEDPVDGDGIDDDDAIDDDAIDAEFVIVTEDGEEGGDESLYVRLAEAFVPSPEYDE